MANKPISAEDFQSWKDNVITQAVFKHFADTGLHIQNVWVTYLRDVDVNERVLQLRQVELKAKIEEIEAMLSVELSDIQEEAEDNAGTVIEQRVERVARRRQA